MNKYIFTPVIIGAFAILSACATAPNPAEICSVDWISLRANKAMTQFERDTKPIFKNLRKLGDRAQDGRNIGPLQMYSLMNSMNKLARKFENGRAMKDMRTLAATCNDPDLIQTAMTDFMRQQGFSEQFIGFLNGFDAYRDLLDTGKRPDLDI